jgi:SSS family solute:Na+ symporter
MLIAFVALYLLVTIAIGLIAARRVHGTKDYLVAGRSLPLYMNMATAPRRCCRYRPRSPRTG